MSTPIISVENISKSYQLGVIGTGTFRGDAQRWWAKLRGLPDPLLLIGEKDHGNREGETVWALKDVSFQVQQGEAMGIIGRNGAGKSTLLKILSRVTAPTSGEVKVRGRIASLLEVGTGFHPELTGRENIFLNGAILGMSRSEIGRKFDEIVDFSGVEKYIDTPVKRYSSGMYVRLAFAVAAHLEPDILIVDEVLAVGDAEFQRKCLGKMDNAAHNDGRTILFVSHNMGMVNSLCNRAIFLDAGVAAWDGPVSEAIGRYYNSGKSLPFALDYSHLSSPPGDEYAILLEGCIEDKNGNATGEVNISEPLYVKMKYSLKQDVPISPSANIHVYNSQGQAVFVTGSQRRLPVNKEGIYEATCAIPDNLLNNDTYSIGLALTFTHNGIHVSFFERNALTVTVRDIIDETLEERRNGYSGDIPGAVRPKLDWVVKRVA
jgi:lipopolysaccharide transport system ATP-binding protein